MDWYFQPQTLMVTLGMVDQFLMETHNRPLLELLDIDLGWLVLHYLL